MAGISEDMGIQILKAVQALGGRADGQDARMDAMETRMDTHEERMERLWAEVVAFREEMRMEFRSLRNELRESFARMNPRADPAAETVVLLAAEMRGPRVFGDNLENHPREPGAR
ncbi:hypothetical protein [Archangium primigenium]|uniref:hypothetical protein n=1 Tax=[Archangium] primigenium TaxID=2792470 RepID=UPI00195C6373|nr:hypothetical protein [Archangium primigenium]MBM7118281.1 hypothetical protein [Archangium primigenium]